MLDRLLGLASAASLTVGAATAPAPPSAEVELTFADPAIVEGSGLVVDAEGLVVTTNDSGDGARIFVVDRSGATVGTTTWSPEPTDVEALAPAGAGAVWVGDIGDNPRARESITVLRVPYGRGERQATPESFELVYPDRAHDAETLMVHPQTGRLLVHTKDVFGGTVYAAPRRLAADRPNRLTEVADGFAFATDGSFFPDGRHYVVRGYTTAAVYTYPGHERVGDPFSLPRQRQGEGVAVTPDGDLLLSTEGQFTDLLRMPLPAAVSAAMAEPGETGTASPGATPDPNTGTPGTSPEASPGTSPGTAPATSGEAAEEERGVEERRPPWAWLVGGAGFVVFVAAAGWLHKRRGQTP